MNRQYNTRKTNVIAMEGMKQYISTQTEESNNSIEKDISALKTYNFFTLNEIRIHNIIRLIPDRSNRFLCITSCKQINIGEVSDSKIIRENINNNPEYMLIKYNKNKKEYIQSLTSFLHNKSPKEYVFDVIESYTYLLKSFKILQENKIVYFDFSSHKMLFHEIDNPHTILRDFENSLCVNKLVKDEQYIYKFIQKIQNFTFKPFEIHILFYLMKMKTEEEYLSRFKINQIIDKFVDNLEDILMDQSKEMIQTNCHDYLDKFANKHKKNIYRDIISHHESWDNYSLSILYLHLVEQIRDFPRSQDFMKRFQNILYKNISQNPARRFSLKETIAEFNLLFQYWVI